MFCWSDVGPIALLFFIELYCTSCLRISTERESSFRLSLSSSPVFVKLRNFVMIVLLSNLKVGGRVTTGDNGINLVDKLRVVRKKKNMIASRYTSIYSRRFYISASRFAMVMVTKCDVTKGNMMAKYFEMKVLTRF